MMLARHIVPWLKYVPFGNGNFSKFAHVGWEWELKYQAYRDFGDAILMASPGKNWIYVCNAETIHDVIQRERRHDFERPVELLAVLDVFGANISTVYGPDWQRHRKVTATAFTEKTNRLVWDEALQQARQMLIFWKSSGEVQSTATDSRTLALDVLVSAGFGKSFPFQGATQKPETGPLSYRDSLAKILENALLILALGPDFVSRIKYPRNLARVGQAITSFRQYMTQDYEEERKAFKEKRLTGENLMTNLVRASLEETASDVHDDASQRKTGLTREEVFGNMFVFNFAGHDTTAHSLNFTFYLLAAHPWVQEWINEEIKYVFRDDDISSWDYDTFPKLNRCLAVLYETLRLYNPLLSVVKGTQDNTTDLTIDGKSYIIPPNTRVILNLNAVHSHPRYWGDDSLEWKPSRWIVTAEGDGASIDREYILTPPRGAFLGWSDGNRACPGKKFAQVEHAAVMAALFHSHRVEPVRLAGEDMEQARKRTADCIANSGMVLLFQMLRPQDVSLTWSKR
ncbi:Cytochrome P450 3A31 [Diplodia seriata]|uniref:Cytochrome P450 3A31 n=1 Tax=Diplodia seriata TaxID=420778 RepID=A0A1S8BNN1_9PEZI|nr:Cytochrome P450 3A31 [Diplodia seriata]